MLGHLKTSRRGTIFGGTALIAGLGTLAHARSGHPRRILLRSGWQIENIGDVAHTPGFLRLVEHYLPHTEVTLWPWYDEFPASKRAMLLARFPTLKIAQGKVEGDRATTPELAEAIAQADFMIHNSGPYALAWQDLESFSRMTGRPYGVFGVTYGHWVFGTQERETLRRASFAFFRDRVSLRKAQFDGVDAPVTEFSPDAAFMADIADDRAAAALMDRFGLQDGRFFVCLPKQRYTPTWLHVRKNRPIDPRQEQRNTEMGEIDHAPLREAIVRLVREGGRQVLIGNEDETEVPIGKTWVRDRLPEDVRARVHWLDRPWSMDEAIGVYRRCEGLFGHEMHSPVLCIGLGVPAVVGRWVEQSSKGTMWNDIGLPEWLINMDCDADIARLPQTVMDIALDPAAARARAQAARQRVIARFDETMRVVADASRPGGTRALG